MTSGDILPPAKCLLQTVASAPSRVRSITKGTARSGKGNPGSKKPRGVRNPKVNVLRRPSWAASRQETELDERKNAGKREQMKKSECGRSNGSNDWSRGTRKEQKAPQEGTTAKAVGSKGKGRRWSGQRRPDQQ
ncbi:hypothetical protein B0H34DRAFT_104947 [Crassisporium funariophilum]|nr:hypothetical protein B0H34DRAFT_104947 [Crassisporium funariophilum]